MQRWGYYVEQNTEGLREDSYKERDYGFQQTQKVSKNVRSTRTVPQNFLRSKLLPSGEGYVVYLGRVRSSARTFDPWQFPNHPMSHKQEISRTHVGWDNMVVFIMD